MRPQEQFQNQTNYYDGMTAITQCGIPPGQSGLQVRLLQPASLRRLIAHASLPLGEFSETTWWQYVAIPSLLLSP